MKRLGIINTEYLFKSIESMFFIEIAIYKAIKKRLDTKNGSIKNDKPKKTNNKKGKKAKNKKKYPVIYSKHAFLFNSIIMVLFVVSSVIEMALTLLWTMALSVCRFILLLVKNDKETICEDTVSSNLDDLIDRSNVIDLQEALNKRASNESKKALPQ